MLEFMVAATDATDFRFDADALSAAAVAQWPGARIIHPTGRRATLVTCDIELPATEPDFPDSEIRVLTGGDGMGLDSATHEEAARVLAWLAQVTPLPQDGSVVVIHWVSDFYPLRPGVTAGQLLRDAGTE